MDEPRVESVVVAEIEPMIVAWFERYVPERAARVAGDARARIVVADVADLLREAVEDYDLVALDTDNGPEWLVREANAGLYSEAGVRLAHDALRAGGAAVFWSPARYGHFEDRLDAVFAERAPGAGERYRGRPVAGVHDICVPAGSGRRQLSTSPRPASGRSSSPGPLRAVHLACSPARPWRAHVGLTWDAPVEIAYALVEAHPEADPLDLNFVELHRWIVELPDFDDDPEAASEAKLEAIVLAWHAEL